MILPAQTIRSLCNPPALLGRKPMVHPFEERAVANGMTYGLGPASIDIRIAETIWLWPGFGRLASAIETFDLPDDVIAMVANKSSNARRFTFQPFTIADPGWRGSLTLELTRHRPWPVLIKAGTPIAQILFMRLERPTDQPYDGRYQDQAPGPQKAVTARIGD